VDSANPEEGLIAEDAEEPRFAEKRPFSVLGEPRLLGVLGDKFLAPNCLDDRFKTTFDHLVQAPRERPAIASVGRGLHSARILQLAFSDPSLEGLGLAKQGLLLSLSSPFIPG